MARKTMWAVAGALLAFAPFAAAEWYGVEYENERWYASEVISDGDVQIDYRGASPTIKFTIYGGEADANLIDEDDTIDVTFTLANAKFGSNVGSGNMALEVENVDAGTCDARVADTINGARGDSAVTFRVEATDADCNCGSACQFRTHFTFSLPRLYSLNTGGVSATITTDTPGGSGWPVLTDAAMNSTHIATDQRCDRTEDAMNPCTNVDDGVLQRQTAIGSNGRRSPLGIINFRSGLTFGGTSGGATPINLAAERRTFTVRSPNGNQAHLGSVTLGVTNAAECTGVTPTPVGCDLQADGRPFSIGRGGEGRGDLEVNVTGDFRSGDVVYLDIDGNRRPSTGESLSLVGGSMTGAFNLLNVAGAAGAGDTDAEEANREEGVATRNLLYAPNGNDPLRPGGYRTSWAVDFSGGASDKGARPASTVANTHTTQYNVVEDDQVAYAIPPGTTGDVGNVRIKCDVATQCTVYLECDHADGRTWFEQVEDPIPGRSTLVLTSESMRTALGMDDDEWTRGRLSCTVYSTRSISLQVLTRSDSGVLVNNTYVDDE